MARQLIKAVLRLEVCEIQKDSLTMETVSKDLEIAKESKKKWYFLGVGIAAGIALHLIVK